MANVVFHIGVLILLIESGQCDPGERVTLLEYILFFSYAPCVGQQLLFPHFQHV